MEVAAAPQYGCTGSTAVFHLAQRVPPAGIEQSGYGRDMSIDGLIDYGAAR
jgi:aminobutyraldehyde dehydrogenase